MHAPRRGRSVQARWFAMVAGAGCVVAAVSCNHLPASLNVAHLASKLPFMHSKPAAEAPAPAIGPTKVVADATALALNEPQRDLALRSAFVQRFQQLLDEERHGAARLLVERHPDLSLDVLRETPEEPPAWLVQLAQLHDEHCSAPAAARWSDMLARAAADGERLAPYSTARGALMAQLRDGQFQQASLTDLTGAAEASGELLLRIDAAYLAGMVHMMAERPAEAATALRHAAELASPLAPYQATHAVLLLSEAQRRAGDGPGANASWQAATSMAADLLILPRPIADPAFWDRAMYLQPIGIQWPPVVAQRVLQMAQRGPSTARGIGLQRLVACCAERQPDAALLSVCIADWRLERGEPEAALVAFKRAESSATADADNWLRVSQAGALVHLEQSGAATTVLAQLATQEPMTLASRAALADMGSIRVHQGALQQGIHFLRKALDATDTPHDWPGRASAEADLALALLMVGEESDGLQWLDRAQRRFEADGELELLAKCLWNEARYHEHKGDRHKTAEVQERVDAMQL